MARNLTMKVSGRDRNVKAKKCLVACDVIVSKIMLTDLDNMFHESNEQC